MSVDSWDDTQGATKERIAVFRVLARGVRESPELRAGMGATVLLALVVAASKLVIPISIQQIIDRGFSGPDGLQRDVVIWSSLVAAVAIIFVTNLSRILYFRLVTTAENTLYGLRTRLFAHIHQLSIAHHNESKRGVLVTRVTSDIETLAQFAQWGAISWIINTTIIVSTLAVLFIYSWQIGLIVLVIFVPIVPFLRMVQRKQIEAYDELRDAVGSTIGDVSEALAGASVVRTYGVTGGMRRRLHAAIRRQYNAQMKAAWYFALIFPVSDVFGGIALASVIGVGAWYGPGWGLGQGAVVGCVFLVNMLLQPIGEIGEVLDQTQTAIAGWNKALTLMDVSTDVTEAHNPVDLPSGPLSIELDNVNFAYGEGELVLRDVSQTIAGGTKVAIVGETGSGKSTFAKLLVRLADPTSGELNVGGIALRDASFGSLRTSVRLVPQDGFLFDGTVLDNIVMGAVGASRADAEQSVLDLQVTSWVASLPHGLNTHVGERGSSLSVGERQLVALLRAQLGHPGLLILDEATSSVDPETEQAMTSALNQMAVGKTLVSIAHRLSTAQNADTVIVFDRGRIVQVGTHEELVAQHGIYLGLYRSWMSNVAEQEP